MMATTGGLFLAKPRQSLAFRHVVFPAYSGRAKLEIEKPAELDANRVATDNDKNDDNDKTDNRALKSNPNNNNDNTEGGRGERSEGAGAPKILPTYAEAGTLKPRSTSQTR